MIYFYPDGPLLHWKTSVPLVCAALADARDLMNGCADSDDPPPRWAGHTTKQRREQLKEDKARKARLCQALAAVVIALRLNAGASQRDLAMYMKPTRTYISKIERGCNTMTLGQMQKFARALGVEPFVFIGIAERLAERWERDADQEAGGGTQAATEPSVSPCLSGENSGEK